MCKNWRKVMSWNELKEKKEKLHKNGWSIMQMNAINNASTKNYNKFVQPIVALGMKKNMWEEERNRGRILKKNNDKQKYEKLYIMKLNLEMVNIRTLIETSMMKSWIQSLYTSHA